MNLRATPEPPDPVPNGISAPEEMLRPFIGGRAVRLAYVADALCPWSYAVTPHLRAAAAAMPSARVELLHGTVFGGERAVPAAEVQWLAPTSRSVANLTGAVFGDGFGRAGASRRMLDSNRAAHAFLTLRSIAPDLALDIMIALQRAWFVDGRGPAELDTVLDVATELGISSLRAQALFDGPLVHAIARAEDRRVQQLEVVSHPALCVWVGGACSPVAVRMRSAAQIVADVAAVVAGGAGRA